MSEVFIVARFDQRGYRGWCSHRHRLLGRAVDCRRLRRRARYESDEEVWRVLNFNQWIEAKSAAESLPLVSLEDR